MPICASQGVTTRLIRSTSSGSCSSQERQLLRQDRHDQQHAARRARRSAAISTSVTASSARHAPRRELLDRRVQRIGEHRADHERRQHRRRAARAGRPPTAASAAQLRMRRCAGVRPIEGPAGREWRRRSMQARRVAVAELDQPLADGEAVARVRHVLEVGRQVGDRGLAPRRARPRRGRGRAALPRRRAAGSRAAAAPRAGAASPRRCGGSPSGCAACGR